MHLLLELADRIPGD